MIIKGHLASKEKKLELYRDFIRQCTSSPASAENYSDFSKINRLIRNRYDGFTEILDYDSPMYLQKIYDELSQLNFFEELDGTADQGKNFKNIGNRYYHNALLMYIKFLKAMRFLEMFLKIKILGLLVIIPILRVSSKYTMAHLVLVSRMR